MAAPARGEEVNELALSLGLSGDEAVTTSRFPRPVSKIAENVTVITAQDIVRLNAHTLAEVLQTVPGFQLDQLQAPGSFVSFTLLSLTSQHILVQLDGIPLNFLSLENFSEVGMIPVQMIERVEILKGAASAAWGSALGGVINIITKSPARDEQLSGMASASYAERSTSDLRGELSGTTNRFSYYLTGGNIHSDGMSEGNKTNLNHGFGKFSYRMPNGGKLSFGLDIRDNSLEQEHSAKYNIHGTGGFSYLNSYLALRYPLAEGLTLELNGRGGRRHLGNQRRPFTQTELNWDSEVTEIYQAVGAELNWGDAENNLSAGLEYDHDDFKQRETINRSSLSNFDLSLDRWSSYLNGTLSFGRLSILPGLRLDDASLLETALSYTLGATFRLTDSTILRAYAARGYSIPVISNLEVLNGQRQLQNVETVQAGMESSAIPYLWLKGTLFYNNIWNIQTYNNEAQIILRGQIRRGFELEFRTSPLYGLALTGGYTYTDAWDKETRAKLNYTHVGPSRGAKLGLDYENSAIGLRGAVTGNYVDWYLEDRVPKQFHPKASSFIWDLHLTQKLFPDDDMSAEIFFSARNIFNGDQYQIDLRPSNPRWFEAGVRYRF
jgi:vitamin B12 transporter